MVQTIENDIRILGEEGLLTDLHDIIENEQTFLINIYGEAGTGKSALLTYLSQLNNGHNYVMLDENSVEESLLQADSSTILLIDNIDEFYSREQCKELMLKVYSQHLNSTVIFTSKSKFFLEALPGISIFNFEIGNRAFNYDEFTQFIQCDAMREIIQENPLPDFILKNTFLFATYCRNFTYVIALLESVVMHLGKYQNITPQQFIQFLTTSELFTKLQQDLMFDTQNVEESDYLFVIRPKDKIEKLRDLIIKYYPDEYVLFEVMKNQFNSSFVENTFNMTIPYTDKVLNICLSYDPIELLVNLLGPRDIILELNARKIGEASFTYSIEDKAKLILKNIGMNILDKPKGLEYFLSRYRANNQLLLEDKFNKMNKEYMIGLGISCYQELEHVFYEMLNFYSIYFYGSMSAFIKSYNEQTRSKKIIEKRITFGQYIGLFSYLNSIGKQEQFQLKMMNLNLRSILPSKLILKAEELSSLRSFFSHYQKVQSFEVPYKTYRNRIMKLYASAIEFLESLKEANVFPEIIKIKEVIFDEFGRKLFVASDWDQTEIRFSLSNGLSNVDIYSHYYILRKNQIITVNPILIPRYLEENQEKFNGEEYDESSQTQQKQGTTLIEKLKVDNYAKILDVGCGNGRTTFELFSKNTTVSIDAFDISDSMVETALKLRHEKEIHEDQINFFVMDAMDLDDENKYDLVFSNATLHWMVDSKTMYRKLYHSLKPGGKLAVHQGGYHCYVGLHDMVKKAIEVLDIQMYYQNWTYPVYYPTKVEYETLLLNLGFTQVRVESVETDGTEYPTLVENFANAGMLPYLTCLPEESLRKKLRAAYLKLCQSHTVDLYTHRLYAFAQKGGQS
ncbi:class I SAM-dependent methyltransferase [Bacillus alkalicellulosilyticus]|uniref:class I SAM-dependent methyltransferase n=1 Tax=Alkalihalobacterium alkalicellulosilyticum TaxID=1912214 RepID=UPI00099636D4|nr:class I SAM-dependent methyltransferase [Bacillus alkalicellulosilyticus]